MSPPHPGHRILRQTWITGDREDRDRWNEEAAFEAELEEDRRWEEDLVLADWQADQEEI